MTISKSNLHHVLATYMFAEEIGASLFCSWFVMPSGSASKCEATLPDSIYIEQVHKILDLAEENFLPVGRMDLSYATVRILSSNPQLGKIEGSSALAEVASKVSCEGCRYRTLIDENGDVFPCNFLQYDAFRMGNLLSDNWVDIWYSRPARFKASLTRSNKPKYKDCEAQFCDTGCFGVSFANYLETGKLLPMCEVLQ
ncbi:SPASM domain-containing protein [Gleimia sp. 6138-11-ORH1]|uniref:SPASM domain-containing protein n=1 Tax=Gleimia sp. 6138-11-ORH1 TaxID=2973937 RepID=UPI002169D2A8|nr:SPASM domain-containing protein [Gleimia sp. 6138-11-ORH1]MCS4484008.1 SPASM domain-containing protein [Gleimia sp. 6138-11-ORH1]